MVFEVLRKTYSWTKPFVLVGDWTNLLSELSSLVFGKVLVGVLIVSLLTAVFVSLIADREVRRRALSGDE